MDAQAEDELLVSVCKESKAVGRLTGKDLVRLHEVFGDRLSRAFETLRENRVKRYVFKPSGRNVWIVVGKERDYLTMPEAEFCTCDDFYFRVVDRKVHLCYHLIAQKLAKALGWFDPVDEHDELFDSLMAEWKKATV
jgi:predicted nucleic acid-binding Zn finger protein